jgi:hypothetical protein
VISVDDESLARAGIRFEGSPMPAETRASPSTGDEAAAGAALSAGAGLSLSPQPASANITQIKALINM